MMDGQKGNSFSISCRVCGEVIKVSGEKSEHTANFDFYCAKCYLIKLQNETNK